MSCGINLSSVQRLPTREEWLATNQGVIDPDQNAAVTPNDHRERLASYADGSKRQQHVLQALNRGRTPGTAYVLSVMLAGLGHFYLEDLVSGVMFLVGGLAMFGLLTGAGGLGLGLVVYLLVWSVALLDIYSLCSRERA